MHRVHVPHADGATVDLAADQAHHLTRVLRLGVGDALVVFDGRGREWDARVLSDDKAKAVVALVARRVPIAEAPVAVTLAISVLTGDQMSEVVRDATALGVTAIAPFLSAHTAVSVRRDWHAARERWERVAVSAAMQCGRAVVPTIGPVSDLRAAAVVTGPGPRIVCVEPAQLMGAGRPIGPRPDAATLFVGPEGGWAADELAAFQASGATLIHLGPRTLRAELAPTVALATLWATWGWGEAAAR